MTVQGWMRRSRVLNRLKELAERLEKETYALYLAYRDPRTPWYAKAFAALVVAHTLSPIDVIPDFIPVLGFLDDLIITPLGIYLALKMIPADVMADARRQASLAQMEGKLRSRLGYAGGFAAGAAIVVTIWVLGAALIAFLVYSYVTR